MKKRLTKSNSNIVVSGVLGGIAEYIGIDATILRVIYVILSMCSFGFPGITIYIILMFIMPANRSNRSNHFFDEQPRYDSHYSSSNQKKRKEAEKLKDEDDWSDF